MRGFTAPLQWPPDCKSSTATVTRVLAEKINEGAASGDVVSGRALERRVNRGEGKDVKIPNRENNQTQKPATESAPTKPEVTQQPAQKDSEIVKLRRNGSPIRNPGVKMLTVCFFGDRQHSVPGLHRQAFGLDVFLMNEVDAGY